jgi:hypothetical protein
LWNLFLDSLFEVVFAFGVFFGCFSNFRRGVIKRGATQPEAEEVSRSLEQIEKPSEESTPEAPLDNTTFQAWCYQEGPLA